MTRLKDRKLTVKADLPEGVDPIDVALFISEALSCWGGQRHPDDPLFSSLNVKSVQIGATEYLITNGDDEIRAKARSRT